MASAAAGAGAEHAQLQLQLYTPLYVALPLYYSSTPGLWMPIKMMTYPFDGVLVLVPDSSSPSDMARDSGFLLS